MGIQCGMWPSPATHLQHSLMWRAPSRWCLVCVEACRSLSNVDRQNNHVGRQGFRYHRQCAGKNSRKGGHSARSAAPHLCGQTA
eukprot:11336696-Karenia_brevis.AAC.1